jgi:hypothetical protein
MRRGRGAGETPHRWIMTKRARIGAAPGPRSREGETGGHDCSHPTRHRGRVLIGHARSFTTITPFAAALIVASLWRPNLQGLETTSRARSAPKTRIALRGTELVDHIQPSLVGASSDAGLGRSVRLDGLVVTSPSASPRRTWADRSSGSDPGHLGASRLRLHHGTPVSRTKRSNSSSFRGESARETLE